ncbi:hypothetical protein [Amycolatopsis sp. NBC_01488]|uniref:hypothetical protein n=1 Tax=Amycolatopsis sp. NBC_01488 TaxID=2903563 RepID=UPI003FA4A05B
MSSGRLTLGVAAGWAEREFSLFAAGLPPPGPIADEYLTALRAVVEPVTDDLSKFLALLERVPKLRRPIPGRAGRC